MKLLIIAFFFISLPLMAAVETISVTWEKDDLVREVYNSPFGKVYRFTPTDNTSRLQRAYRNSSHSKDCDCESCRYLRQSVNGGTLQIKFPKKKSPERRFLVIDFSLRPFPAFSKNKSDFQFLFFESKQPPGRIPYTLINGMWTIKRNQVLYSLAGGGSVGSKYLPDTAALIPEFEPTPHRIIYDFQENKTFYSTGKFNTTSVMKNLKSKKKKNVYFALTCVSAADARTEYLELSNPAVYICDTEKEIEKLPKPEFKAYDYSRYSLDTKKKNLSSDDRFKLAKREKNPDLQYAFALRYLSGSGEECNPANAIELLERAAKDKHVMALYQLGLCYFRGYGVEPDLKKALEYLEDSEKYGYSIAGALRWHIELRQSGIPWFAGKKIIKSQQSLKPYNRLDHNFVFTGIWPSTPTPMLSPKLLDSRLIVLNSRNSKGQKYVDQVIKSGYPNAYWSKAIYEYGFVNPEKCLELLEKGVKAGDQEAWPDMMLYRLRAHKPVSVNDFTKLTDLKYADQPLYYVLQYAVKENVFPYLNNLISPGVYPTKENFDKRFPKQNAETQTVYALLAMYCFQYMRYTEYRKNLTTDKEAAKFDVGAFWENVFQSLLNAANQNHPVALYWIGRCHYYNDFPEKYQSQRPATTESQKYFNAESYLNKAIKQGSLPARLLYAELLLSKKSPAATQALNLLKEPAGLSFGPAVYLTAKALYLLNRVNDAGKYAQLAVRHGDCRGWQLLALLAEKRKQSKDACKYWQQFISADQEKRKLDRVDPYWPNLYAELR